MYPTFCIRKATQLVRASLVTGAMAVTGGAVARETPSNYHAQHVTDQYLSDFYLVDAGTPLPAPGTLVKHEPLTGDVAQEDASASYRILYASTDGITPTERTMVSGAVYLPKGKAPAGGWPIIAWSHGTRGVADSCAPSWTPRAPERKRYLNRWLNAGFAVVASDYQGLGTPGVHPYLLYRPEGYSILDAVRAALKGWPELRNQVVIVGQSQGGGAALGAAWLAPEYAADLNLAATIATGATSTFGDTGKAPQLTPKIEYEDSAITSAYEAAFLYGTISSLDPKLDVAHYVTEAGQVVMAATTSGCFRDAVAVAEKNHVLYSGFYSRNIDALDALQVANDRIPSAHYQSPVFLGIGMEDHAVHPKRQFNNYAAMCDAGTRVYAHFYPGENHLSTVNHSFDDSLAFIRQAMAGTRPPADNCGEVPSMMATLTAKD